VYIYIYIYNFFLIICHVCWVVDIVFTYPSRPKITKLHVSVTLSMLYWSMPLSRRLVAGFWWPESWAHYQANPRECYGVKNDTETGLFPLSFHQCSISSWFTDLRRCIILKTTANLNKTLNDKNSPLIHSSVGNAVAQLVEALPYKPKGRRFYSRWRHWHFSLI
jgi:hypothetical protein